MPDETNGPKGPAGDPWWRFTPRSLGTGYAGLIAALYALAWSAWSLLAGGLDTRRTVLFALLAVVALLWLCRAATGLAALMRDQGGR